MLESRELLSTTSWQPVVSDTYGNTPNANFATQYASYRLDASGNLWETAGGKTTLQETNITSAMQDAGGRVLALSSNDILWIQNGGAGSWSSVGSSVAQVIVADSGATEFRRDLDGLVYFERSTDKGWTQMFSTPATGMVAGDNGRDAYVLTAQDDLFSDNGNINGGVTVDARSVAQVMVADAGNTTYYRDLDDHVYGRQTADIPSKFYGPFGFGNTNIVDQMTVGDNGHDAYFVTSQDVLYSDNGNVGTPLSIQAQGVLQVMVGDGGNTTYYRDLNGHVYGRQQADITNKWYGPFGFVSTNVVDQMAVGDNGRAAYFLTNQNVLFSDNGNVGTPLSVQATGVLQVMVADEGITTYYRDLNGFVYGRQEADITNKWYGPFSFVTASVVDSMAVGDNGQDAYFVTNQNVLYSDNGNVNRGVAVQATGVQQVMVADSGDTTYYLSTSDQVFGRQTADIPTKWYGPFGFGTTSVVNSMVVGDNGQNGYFVTGQNVLYGDQGNVNRGVAVQATGVLQVVVADSGNTTYCRTTNNQVFGRQTADIPSKWYGPFGFGGTDVSTQMAVGNNGRTAYFLTQANELWSDNGNVNTPLQKLYQNVCSFSVDSSGQLWVNEPTAATTYTPVSGSLFGPSGPLFTDVHQGAEGDCWLMASLAEVAARDPADIRNMFTAAGTNVENGSVVSFYTVRFFNSAGVPKYVTVDTELPSGGNYYDQVTNGVLWVALAEKAYAEANASGYVTTFHGGIASYDALGNLNDSGGYPYWALQAITGKPASSFSTDPSNIAAALSKGELVVLGSSPKANDNLVVGDSNGTHAYAVVNYNASAALPFELYNPWGTSSTVPYNGGTVYGGVFYANAALIMQDFASQSVGAGTKSGGNGSPQVGCGPFSAAPTGGEAVISTESNAAPPTQATSAPQASPSSPAAADAIAVAQLQRAVALDELFAEWAEDGPRSQIDLQLCAPAH